MRHRGGKLRRERLFNDRPALHSHICPEKDMSFAEGDDFDAENAGVIKYEVRRTKYEVKELSAKELRRQKR